MTRICPSFWIDFVISWAISRQGLLCGLISTILSELSNQFYVTQFTQGDKHALNRVVVEALEDCAQNNIKYIELRFCPFLLASAEIEPYQESL